MMQQLVSLRVRIVILFAIYELTAAFARLSGLRRDRGELLEAAPLAAETSQGDLASLAPPPPGVSLFVGVLSARSNVDKREAIRETLHIHGWNLSTGPVDMRFELCLGDDGLKERLKEEQLRFGDLVFLNCREGKDRTMMTNKVMLAMQAYSHSDLMRQAFMKIEDDTFVPWRRLLTFLGRQSDLEHSYMGIQFTGRRPNRDVHAPWYQPEDVYALDRYPPYMDRVGYVVGDKLVRGMCENAIPEAHMLTNEDQAVGVWVDAMKQQTGLPVNYVDLRGTWGYNPNDPACNAGTWADYPYLLHHKLKPAFMSCLSGLDHQDRNDASVEPCFADSIFVAVFSARRNVNRRKHVRVLLRNARPDRIQAKFAICNAEDDMTGALKDEANVFDDILLLECQEGYDPTLLTKKVMASILVYNAQYRDQYMHFMKVDDDTFVSWRRLIKLVALQPDTKYAYMGIKGPDTMPVNRDINNPWYQSREVYPNDTYPLFMEGGSGYILGRGLVHDILQEGVAEHNILSNEDQATGVWVYTLKSRGEPVQYVHIPGTDGYRPEFDVCIGKWADYPYMLHHKLDGKVISCLSEIEARNLNDDTIDECFESCRNNTAVNVGNRLKGVEQEFKGSIDRLKESEDYMKALMSKLDWLKKLDGPPAVSDSIVSRSGRLLHETEQSLAKLQEASDSLTQGYWAEMGNPSLMQTTLRGKHRRRKHSARQSKRGT